MYLPEELYQIFHSSNLVPESGLFIDIWGMPQKSIHSGLPAVCLFASVVPLKGWWKASKRLLRAWLEWIKHCIYYKSNTPAESLSASCVVSCFPLNLAIVPSRLSLLLTPFSVPPLSPSPPDTHPLTHTLSLYPFVKWCSCLLVVIKSKVGCSRVCLKAAQDVGVPSLLEP